MSPLNPAILKAAYTVAQDIIDRGDPPIAIYPVTVGSAYLYLSADRDKIVGPDTIRTGATVFYLGFRKSDLNAHS